MVFANIDDWQSSAELERNGVDLDLGRGRVITIRRAGGANRDYTVALTEEATRCRGHDNELQLSEDEADRLLQRVYARAVVVGWRGLVNGDGSAIPFSAETCLCLFAEAPEIWRRVRQESERLANFRQQQLDADADTLGKP